jgi:hypothetical protein
MLGNNMKLLDTEYYSIIEMFEKEYKNNRLDKEDKSFWHRQIIYQDGNTNNLFLSYIKGYTFGKLNA